MFVHQVLDRLDLEACSEGRSHVDVLVSPLLHLGDGVMPGPLPIGATRIEVVKPVEDGDDHAELLDCLLDLVTRPKHLL